jgi:hypothetical protein
MRSTLALVAAVAGLALFPAVSPSLPRPVAPKNCNFMTVKGKRYNVKADQLSCTKARRLAARVLNGGGDGKFSCQSNPTGDIRLYCRKGNSYIYVIKR